MTHHGIGGRLPEPAACGGSASPDIEPGPLTTEQLRDVLREALSVEPDPLAIAAMFGSAMVRKASPHES